jgi:hypothetical protein
MWWSSSSVEGLFSPTEVGGSCISGEQLARRCPSWYHGRPADVASLAVTPHCQVTFDALLAVHKALMEHCTGWQVTSGARGYTLYSTHSYT